MAITQLVLTWTLLIFLLLWMVIFAVLAIRRDTREQALLEELPTPSQPIPTPAMLHVITSPPLQSRVNAISSEPPSDLGAAPVA